MGRSIEHLVTSGSRPGGQYPGPRDRPIKFALLDQLLLPAYETVARLGFQGRDEPTRGAGEGMDGLEQIAQPASSAWRAVSNPMPLLAPIIRTRTIPSPIQSGA